MRKGIYYKVVGGDFGVYWNGRQWTPFGCLHCEIARGTFKSIDRFQGPMTNAMKIALAGHLSGADGHKHDRNLH